MQALTVIDGAGLGYHQKRSLAKEMLIVPGDNNL